MASSVKVQEKHVLTIPEVKLRLSKVEDKLKESGIKVKWISDTQAEVSGRGVSGNLDILPHIVTVDLTLAWYLSVVRTTIQKGIEEELTKALS